MGPGRAHRAPPRRRRGSLARHGTQRPDQLAATPTVAIDILNSPTPRQATTGLRWIVDTAHDWQDRPVVETATLRDAGRPTRMLAELINTAVRPPRLVESFRCRVFTGSPARSIVHSPDPRRLRRVPMLPRHHATCLVGTRRRASRRT